MRANKTIWFALISLGFTIILYFPILDGEALWDDHIYLFRPRLIELNLWNYFNRYEWPIFHYFIDFLYLNFGKNLFIFHSLSIFFHLANGILLFVCLKKIIPRARFVALMFLLHPAQVLSVAWMVQIKTLLAANFVLLAVFFFLKFEELKRRKYFVLTVIFFILACKVKYSFVTLPLALIPYYLFIKSQSTIKLKLKNKITFGIIIIGFGFYMFSLFYSGRSLSHLHDMTDQLYQVDILKNATHYLKASLLPYDFSPIYQFSNQTEFIPSIAVVTILFLLIIFGRNWKFSLIALMTFLLLNIPFWGIIFAPYMKITPVSDQHLYLALIPLLILIANFFEKLEIRFNIKRLAVTALALTCSWYFYVGLRYVPVYKSENNFYQAILTRYPYHMTSLNNFISYLARVQNYELAVKLMRVSFGRWDELQEFDRDNILRIRKHISKFYPIPPELMEYHDDGKKLNAN